MWAAVLVALLVGGVVGYLLGWGLGPTETVAPPSYATGEFGAAVTFEGGTCMYNGPAEQPAGTPVDFSFTGAEGSSLVLFHVEPGTTYEEAAKASLAWGSPPGLDERIVGVSTPAQLKLDEGLWVVGCADPNSSAVFTATMLRVVPR